MVLLVVGLVGVVVIESILLGRWNKAYFQSGIPIFERTITVLERHRMPTPHDVQDSIPEGIWTRILFKDLGGNCYAFREQLFWFTKMGYTPVMRGVLRFDSALGKVVVTGHLNLFPPIFVIACIPLTIREPGGFVAMWWFWLPLLAILGGIYWIQRRRFYTAGKTAAGLWGDKASVGQT